MKLAVEEAKAKDIEESKKQEEPDESIDDLPGIEVVAST